jgi:MFS family permease
MLAFITRNARWIAGGFLLTYFSSFGQTFFISASVAEWQETFDLSHGQFGMLYMGATLASALCLPFVGRLVDVIPEHKVIAFVVPVLAAAALLAAYAPTLAVLGIAIFLLRLFGQGMMTHIALTATGRWFAAQRGRAVSLVVLGHQGGEGTLPLIFSTIAIVYGFRAGWVAGALALLVVALPLGVWAYATPRTPRPPGKVPGNETVAATRSVARRDWSRSEVLRDPIFWVLLTGVLAPPFIGTTIFFHQDYLTALRNWSPQFYALSLTVMAVTTVVFALIHGAVIDRFGSTAVLPYFLLPLAGSCFALSIDGPPATLFLVMVLLGVSYGISSTLFGAVWAEIYGVTHLGAVRSLVVSAMVFATAAGPGVTGTLIDRGISLPEQMTAIALYCLIASGVMTAASLRLRKRVAVRVVS